MAYNIQKGFIALCSAYCYAEANQQGDKMRLLSVFGIGALGLNMFISACAAIPACGPDVQRRMNATVPICGGEDECKQKWEKAQIWMAQNSQTGVRIANDTLIETYSLEHDTHLSYQVIKMPRQKGVYAIVVKAGCNNIFGCMQNSCDAILNFNQFVNQR